MFFNFLQEFLFQDSDDCRAESELQADLDSDLVLTKSDVGLPISDVGPAKSGISADKSDVGEATSDNAAPDVESHKAGEE